MDVILRPEVPTQDNCPVLARMSAYFVDQGQLGALEWRLRDRQGRPIDLSAAGSDAALVYKYRAREVLGCARDGVKYYEEDAEVVDFQNGVLRAPIEDSLVQAPGIYEIQWAALQDGRPLYVNSGLMSVEPTLFGETLTGPKFKPLTLQELRLYIRDNAPSENYKLRRQEFSDAEVLQAILWPLRDFQEAPPPLVQQFTSCNFPWRENQLRAAMGRLFELAAIWQRRNKFAYSAGNLTVQEEATAEEYQQQADKILAEWRVFRDATKLRINSSETWDVIDSPYAYRW